MINKYKVFGSMKHTFILALNMGKLARTKQNYVSQKHPETKTKPSGEYTNVDYLASLKYRIRATARIRTAIMMPMIHLFLLILLDIFVKILLLLPTLSSTPWSCNQKETPT